MKFVAVPRVAVQQLPDPADGVADLCDPGHVVPGSGGFRTLHRTPHCGWISALGLHALHRHHWNCLHFSCKLTK